MPLLYIEERTYQPRTPLPLLYIEDPHTAHHDSLYSKTPHPLKIHPPPLDTDKPY
nr:MAG TPA_asm: hypothetical protein [Caudoviricetes sp.]